MNRVKEVREQKNLTQTELAEKAGLSLRTIQRVESGNVLKGFTLIALAKALGTTPENLYFKTPTEEVLPNTERAKLINFSALAGLIIPYGGIIVPLILTSKTKDSSNKILGKNIVSVQIVLTVIFSVFLIAIPFVQKYFSVKMPLFLIAILIFIALKLLIVILNGFSLNKSDELYKHLKINFL